MKNYILSLLFIFLNFSCNKNNNLENELKHTINHKEKKKLKGCGYNKLIEIEENYLPAEDRVKQIISNIVTYSGLPDNFKVYRADYINNAFATIKDGERIIVYDSKMFNDVEWYSDTFWSSVSILAHEIGHHLSGHTEDGLGSKPDKELEADKFSGFVLYKMGASLEQSIKAIELYATDFDSDTHPKKSKRIKSITEGWEDANNQRFNSALPPSPKDNPNDYYTFTKEMLIDNEHLNNKRFPNWFEFNGYLYGIITEIDRGYEYFNIRIISSSDEFSNDFRSITNENWEVNIESNGLGSNTEMCRACSENLKSLITPGRRLKFSMVESLPDHGTSLNGVWFLTFAQALPNNYFDK